MKRIVRFFTENWALKLTALVLAILLWLAVQSSTPQRATFRNVPVRVDLRDPDWRLVGEPSPNMVSLSVMGSRGELVSLANSPPRIVLPVERVNDTVQTQVVPLQWVRIPEGLNGVRILNLQPDTVRLRYERLAARTLPVQVRVKGELPRGFALTLPVSTNPSTVEVRGPRTRIEALDSIPLLPVDVDGLRSNTNVPASVDTSALKGLRIEPTEVNVVLQVQPADSVPAPGVDTAQGSGAPE